jgi:hypothetical protein
MKRTKGNAPNAALYGAPRLGLVTEIILILIFYSMLPFIYKYLTETQQRTKNFLILIKTMRSSLITYNENNKVKKFLSLLKFTLILYLPIQ